MPIANCFLNEATITTGQAELLSKEWSELINVAVKDICLSFCNVSVQTGQTYKVIVHLFLPTLWTSADVKKIQLSLDKLLKKHLKLTGQDVFIITTLIQPGNVVEDGQVVTW